MRVAGERSHVEGVAPVQPGEGVGDGLLGFFDGRAHHGKRRIEHENDLLGRDVLGRRAFGRSEDEREEAAAAVAVRKQGGLDAAAGDAELRDEILVAQRRLGLGPGHGPVRCGPFDENLLRFRFHVPNRDARVHAHLDRDVTPGARAAKRNRRRDARCVRRPVGVLGPTACLPARGPARYVTRPAHDGKTNS